MITVNALPCPTCDPTPHSTPHVLHLTRHSRPLHYIIPSASSESKEIERAGGYKFTVTQMLPNSFAFGGGNAPASFQRPHGMETVLPSLLHVLCETQGAISYTLMPCNIMEMFDYVQNSMYNC